MAALLACVSTEWAAQSLFCDDVLVFINVGSRNRNKNDITRPYYPLVLVHGLESV